MPRTVLACTVLMCSVTAQPRGALLVLPLLLPLLVLPLPLLLPLLPLLLLLLPPACSRRRPPVSRLRARRCAPATAPAAYLGTTPSTRTAAAGSPSAAAAERA